MAAPVENQEHSIDIADLDLGEIRKLKDGALIRGLERILEDVDHPQSDTAFNSAI